MKGKQLIGMGLGLASVCVALYRAPQIMDAVGGGKAGLSVGQGEAGGAVASLLQAIGKQPMDGGELAALGLTTGPADQAGTAPEASDLRIFGANLSEAEARQALERAAMQHPAKSIRGGTVATNDAASVTKKLKHTPKVVVHKTKE